MPALSALDLARASLGLAAVAFAAFGTLLLVRPDTLALVGVGILRPAGAVELRGFYGGLELGLAFFFVIALARRAWHAPALVLQIATLGGAAAGRVFGLALGGGAESWILGLLSAEAAGAALGLLALTRLRERERRPAS